MRRLLYFSAKQTSLDEPKLNSVGSTFLIPISLPLDRGAFIVAEQGTNRITFGDPKPNSHCIPDFIVSETLH
jgi:hypothetical protein